jgi:hypothetical protein
VFECNPGLLVDWRTRWHCEAHRILVHAVDMELVMQVRSRCQARASHQAHDLALHDTFSGANALCKRGQVRIQGGVTVRMANDHRIAVAAFAAGELDEPIGGYAHPGA